MLFLVLLLLSTACTDAVVNFKRSMIIDQYDLEGVAQFEVKKICDYGCHIWASIPPGTEDIAKNIHIDDDFFFNLAEIATMYDPSTLQKKPMYIDDADRFIIYNENVNQTTVPLIIYIVSTRASNLNTVEVYDAHNMNRMTAPAKQITIMSAAPFTVVANQSEANGVTVRTTGFDDVDDDNKDSCYSLLSLQDSKAFPGFYLEVSSPLLSMSFNHKKYPNAIVHLSSTIGTDGHLDLTRPGYVSSPGYIGCSSGEVFRSSLYSDFVSYSITTNDMKHVFLNGDVHTDQDHPVHIVDGRNNNDYPMFGNSIQSQDLFTNATAATSPLQDLTGSVNWSTSPQIE